MISARIMLAAVAASLAVPAAAAVEQPFERTAFEAAQAAGRPILVDVAAWWCPVCASQRGTLKQAFTDSRYEKLIVFKINYDKQKDEWKSFGVQKQATLIAFRGKQEIGRLAFVTDKAKINALLAATTG